MDKKDDKTSKNVNSNSGKTVTGILTASILAYCGYKINTIGSVKECIFGKMTRIEL